MNSISQNKIKAFIKGSSGDRVEYWDLDKLDNDVTASIVNNKLYLLSGFKNGKEEFIAIPSEVWSIHDALSEFFIVSKPPQKILTFSEDNLKICELLLHKHTDIEKRLFGQKIGQRFDYLSEKVEIKKLLATTDKRSKILRVVTQVLQEQECDTQE